MVSKIGYYCYHRSAMSWKALCPIPSVDESDVPIDIEYRQLVESYRYSMQEISKVELSLSSAADLKHQISLLDATISSAAALLDKLRDSQLALETEKILYFAYKQLLKATIGSHCAVIDCSSILSTCADNLERMKKLQIQDVEMITIAIKLSCKIGDLWTAYSIAGGYECGLLSNMLISHTFAIDAVYPKSMQRKITSPTGCQITLHEIAASLRNSLEAGQLECWKCLDSWVKQLFEVPTVDNHKNTSGRNSASDVEHANATQSPSIQNLAVSVLIINYYFCLI